MKFTICANNITCDNNHTVEMFQKSMFVFLLKLIMSVLQHEDHLLFDIVFQKSPKFGGRWASSPVTPRNGSGHQ